jgi:hypothetical protein
VRGGTRVAGTLALVAAVLAVLTGCMYNPVSSRPACADAVLDDWSKGALDSVVHPLDCYDAAIDALPEDLRAYTSAADDISRAAIAANRASASVATDGDSSQARQLAATPESEGLRTVPRQVVLLVVLVTLLVASGLAASVIRRRRAR